MILDTIINEYFIYYCEYKHIENINPQSIKKLLKSSILKIYGRYNVIPAFQQIDIILYILDIDEHYKSSYFLTIYEILFTNTAFETILQNHAIQKPAQKRLEQLIINLYTHRKEVNDYVGLSAYRRITRFGNCIKNNYFERINRNLLQ